MSAEPSRRLFLSPPHLSGEELTLVHKAFASNYIAPVGPMMDAFEAEFAAYTGIGTRWRSPAARWPCAWRCGA
ncbi:MAG: hypothetical protein SCH98_09705 [Deferrisomatales bacterium]|nr:hypothetical protein [Deferrisomatales bacterium]